MGIALTEHRAKPLIQEMVEEADCIFAMDFQNKAELPTVYPDLHSKIYMLSAFADSPGDTARFQIPTWAISLSPRKGKVTGAALRQGRGLSS